MSKTMKNLLKMQFCHFPFSREYIIHFRHVFIGKAIERFDKVLISSLKGKGHISLTILSYFKMKESQGLTLNIRYFLIKFLQKLFLFQYIWKFKGHSTWMCGNYSRAETIWRNTVNTKYSMHSMYNFRASLTMAHRVAPFHYLHIHTTYLAMLRSACYV